MSPVRLAGGSESRRGLDEESYWPWGTLEGPRGGVTGSDGLFRRTGLAAGGEPTGRVGVAVGRPARRPLMSRAQGWQ